MRTRWTKEQWLEFNGFSADGFTYCVIGDNTFAIKDWLKENGYKFNPTLKWHGPQPLELPEGYGHLTLSFDDIAVWDSTYHDVNYYEKTKAIVDKAFKDAAGPSLSEFVGEVGLRLRNLTAIYESTRGFSGAYGWTNIHTFKIGEDVLVWFTTKDLDLELGATVDLTGTVKKHEEFRGVKTTQLSRCIIKEVA